MKQYDGIHFYINITNLNQIALDEEKTTGRVNHTIHAMDTFFSSVESFGKHLFPNTLVIEKITGSRLHIYVTDNIKNGYAAVKQVSSFAYRLIDIINFDIAKYKSLKKFQLQVGAALGKFYDFVFTAKNEYTEETTIGFAANYAAKLQSLAGISEICISEDMYNSLSGTDKTIYRKASFSALKKYEQSCCYITDLARLSSGFHISDKDYLTITNRANNLNLSDIVFTPVRQTLNFGSMNVKQCKVLNGIPVFADIRSFTSQFASDDSNLEEMSGKTLEILTRMYQTTTDNGGIHIQFQGDRELALFHDIPASIVNGVSTPEKKCYKQAILTAMRMVDIVKPFSIHIGVGEDYGKLFATKIGARGEKDNILLGETVINADFLEDEKAGEDHIAISNEVYNGLIKEDRRLARRFHAQDDYYITTVGFDQYTHDTETERLQTDTKQKNYNPGWSDYEYD